MPLTSNFIRLFVLTLVITGLLAAPSTASAKSERDAAWWTDASRILAGERPNAASDLAKLGNEPAVAEHRKLSTRSWTQFENARLKPTIRFANTELLRQAQSTGPVFYPFSGPDALYALAMFPHATDYVLMGLEPVGELPDLAALSSEDLAESLAELRRSLRSLKAFSFFRTNDMRAEFGKNRFSGVTPILMLFIARHGFAVQSVEPVIIEPDAALRVSTVAGQQNLAADRVPGVRIRFIKEGETKPRTLLYFRADLSNSGLTNVPQTLKWTAALAPRAAYLKAASYLMHNTHFSKVRDFILANTDLVVQDDSGIPLRFFSADHWDRTFFGAYDGPIKLFANRYQDDLREAYEMHGHALQVGIGYDHQAKASNIQRFVRKRGAGVSTVLAK